MMVNLEYTVAKELPLEDVFDTDLRENGIVGYERNAKFIPSRRFQADFWFKDLRLAVEVDGGIFMRTPSGHTSGKGYHSDRVRDQLALSHNIITVRFTTPQVRSGEGIKFLMEYLPIRTREVDILNANGVIPFREQLPITYGESTTGAAKKKAKAKKRGEK